MSMIPNIIIPLPQKKRKGIASTNTTNELVDAIRMCGQVGFGTPAYNMPRLIPVRVRIDTDLNGGGKYFGWFRNMPETKIDTETDLSDAELGTNLSPCYIMNTVERGLSTHDLTESPIQAKDFGGWLLPQIDASTGYPWVEITAYDIFNCAG